MSDENRQGSGNFRANNGGQKRPAGGNRMSGNRTGGKNFGGKKPFSGEKRSFGGSKPAFGGEKRTFGGDKPAYNGEKRSFGGDKPAYNGVKRSFGGDKPAYNGEKRAFGGDKPAYNGEKRAFRGDKHNDGDKRPAKSGFSGENARMGTKSRPSVGKQDSTLPKNTPMVATMGNAVPIHRVRLPRRWRAATVCPRAVSHSKSSAR